MNVARLEEIAAWLEDGAPARNGVIRFDYSLGIAVLADAKDEPECGTTCCIAGAAFCFFAPEHIKWAYNGVDERRLHRGYVGRAAYAEGSLKNAGALLGLNADVAEELFYAYLGELKAAYAGLGYGSERAYRKAITPAHAARCIRHLIATGIVDWEGTRNAADVIKKET